MTEDEARKVAVGLTKAQQEAIKQATFAPATVIQVLPIYRDGGALSRSLVDLGLAGWSSRGAALNRNGKQVRYILVHRKILQEQAQ